MKYRSKTNIVEAVRFRTGMLPTGVFIATDTVCKENVWPIDSNYVITIHGQKTLVVDGDWIITEPDGIHHYPCKPDIFEKRYEKYEPMQTKGVNFSEALAAMKLGMTVSRAGWNGEGMYAFIQKGYPDGIALNKNTAEASGIPEGTVCKFRPYFMLWTAQKDFAHWVPSGSDILATDWELTLPNGFLADLLPIEVLKSDMICTNEKTKEYKFELSCNSAIETWDRFVFGNVRGCVITKEVLGGTAIIKFRLDNPSDSIRTKDFPKGTAITYFKSARQD